MAVADMFDYLKWRGDISFTQVPPGSADALIFSALAYIRFDGLVRQDLSDPVPLHLVAEQFLQLPDQEQRILLKPDIPLLKAAAESPRFRNVKLAFHRDIFIPEEETQFAAVAWLLPDGSAFLSFRGTDLSLVSWKEDFNMSFQDFVPAQQLAAAYIRDFAAVCDAPVRMGGHSKGGNLAVFAAAEAGEAIQQRILAVYNNDGPGFTDYLMGSPGYLAMTDRIHTYIPQSSIIGMLLEHEEPYTVIKSRQVGILQHDHYSWEIMGSGFVHQAEISESNRFLDKTIKAWIADMSKADREKFVDAMFDLLGAGDADTVMDLLHPRHLHASIMALAMDENLRNLFATELLELIRSAQEIRESIE